MALIDLLTNLSSFDYDKIGTKQGEYFGEDRATGFTTNRQQGDPTEFNRLFADADGNLGPIPIPNTLGNHPGPVNFFEDTDATGFTIGRQQGNPTEYISKGTSGFSNGEIFSNKLSDFRPNWPGGSDWFPKYNPGGIANSDTNDGFKLKENDLNKERETSFDVSNENLKTLYDSLDYGDDEPFITKEIGDRYADSPFDDLLGRGGIITRTQREKDDIVRIGKFLASSKGLLFQAKQGFLQFKNPRNETRLFNPLSTIASLPAGLTEERHIPALKYTDIVRLRGDDETNFGSEQLQRGIGFADPKPLTAEEEFEKLTAGPGNIFQNFGKNLKSRIKNKTINAINQKADSIVDTSTTFTKSLIRYGTRQLEERTGIKGLAPTIEVDTDLQIAYGGTFGNLSTESQPDDLIKFKIRDAVNGKWIIFPAYLSDITDNSTAEYATERYIGRADSVHIYQGYSRTISLSFKVVALARNDVPIIWEKINYLKGLTLPTYKKQMDELRPVAPYIYLTIGDLFSNTPGYFSSVGITIPESATWEISEGIQVPQVCDVSAEFTYIGKQTPHQIGKQYDGLSWIQGTHLDVGSANYDRATFLAGENSPISERVQNLGTGEVGVDNSPKLIDGGKINLRKYLSAKKKKAFPNFGS